MAQITVLMAVHNGLPFIREAVESILGQTFRDFEFLIVDDDSTDGTRDFLVSISDDRVRIIHTNENIGQSASLNLGLSETHTPYIARMDADDIAHPERLQKQRDFLEKKPPIGLLGTWCEVINPQGTLLGQRTPPCTHEGIRWMQIFTPAFIHPSTMFRRSLLQKHKLRYSENKEFQIVEDYLFWNDLLQFTQGANLPHYLLKYRSHPKAMSSSLRNQQILNQSKVAREELRKLGCLLSPQAVERCIRNIIDSPKQVFPHETRGAIRDYEYAYSLFLERFPRFNTQEVQDIFHNKLKLGRRRISKLHQTTRSMRELGRRAHEALRNL